ncbi:MAG: FAD-dependent oxidoreductase [Burkholderiales bacterium]|nr:FAD-dependent oxidoreductase [Burkholderiales bacterium]
MSQIVVVGGGTSGFAAAIAAARAGAKVTLLEQSSYLGGTMTGGLVPGLVSLRHQPWRDEETLVQMESLYSGDQVVRGIAQELVDRLVRVGGAYGHEGESPVRVLFDQELAKAVIDAMVREAGVEVLFQTKVIGVTRDANRVTGVRYNYDQTLPADVVIDATGDGHVAWLAGADFEQGERGDATYVQPMTMYFLMGGVELRRTVDYISAHPDEFTPAYIRKLRELFEDGKPLTIIALPSLREKAIAAGDYPVPYGATSVNPRAHLSIFRPVFRSGKVLHDVTMHNVDMAYRVDATDLAQLSSAISSMRDFTVRIAGFFRKYVPGFEKAYLFQIADAVGVRETRRIVGDYMLTGDDVIEAHTFPDSIGYCGATVDVHNVEGGREKTRMTAIKDGRLYQIPYRILLPKGIEGLMVAGRCVSADRTACGSIRQQAGCIVTGQAAGAAAALAVRHRTTPRALAVAEVQAVLRTQGAIV